MYKTSILHLDDSEEDLEIIKRRLIKELDIGELRQERKFDSFASTLVSFKPDIILSEFYLPDIDGFEIIDYLNNNSLDIPIVFITGRYEEDIIVKSLKKGASDFISKDNLQRVGNSIQRSIREHEQQITLKETETKLIESESRFRNLVEKSSDWIWQLDKNMQFVYSSQRVLNILGYKVNEIINKKIYKYISPEDIGKLKNFLRNKRSKNDSHLLELIFCTKDNRKIYIEVNYSQTFDSEGNLLGYEGIARDITARKEVYLLQELNNKRSQLLLELPEIIKKYNTEDFIKTVVEKIVDLTSSRCGMIINHGNNSINLYYSNDTASWQNFKVDEEYHINDFLTSNRIISSESIALGNDNISVILADKKIEYNRNDSDTLSLTIKEISRLSSLSHKIDEIKLRDKKLEEAQSLAKLGYWEWDFLTNSYTWSDNIYSLVGLNKNEKPIGIKEIKKHVSKESYRTMLGNFFKFRKECGYCSCDVNVKRPGKDDLWLTVRGVCSKNKAGIKNGIHGTVQDITDRVKKEQELKEFEIAIRQISESIVITDLKGNIVFINDAYLLNSGYKREDLLGNNSRILQSGRTPKETYKAMWNALTAGKSWKGFFYNKRKNNEEFVEFAIITPLKKPDGKIYRYIGVKEDITEKIKLGEELDRYREKLEILVEERTKQLEEALLKSESSIRAKETFLRNMSHEIRTPMNAILGMVELISETELTELQKKYIKKINLSGKLLLNIINDILDISKIDSDMMVLESSPVCLDKVLSDLLELFNPEAEEKGLKLKIVNNTEIEYFLGDRLRLSQVLINLIKNAIKFTNKGHVVIEVNCLKEFRGKLFLKFSVKDTGLGIDKSAQEKLFQPFEQEDSSTTRRFGGTGLGLAITKQIIRLMEGDLKVESEKGQGSEFWFTIVVEECVIDKDYTNINNEVNIDFLEPLGSISILIAEDDETNRFVIEGLLKNNQVKITVVENGLEAVYAVEKEHFDLIIMDMQMPVMGGLEASNEIKDLELGKNVPILALTANAYEKDKEECLRNGIDDFVTKPCRKVILFSKIYNLLVRKYIDDKYINELFPSKMDKYQQLAARFFQRYENISEVLNIEDETQLKSYVHKLKGAAATLGLKQISYFANLIEMNPRKIEYLNALIENFTITKKIVNELN